MDAEALAPADEPIMLGVHWVAVHLDDMPDRQVRLHVSIALEQEELLRPGDISVGLTGVPAGSTESGAASPPTPAAAVELEQVEGPDPAYPLPFVETLGRTAVAQYTFANPDGLVPGVLTVTLTGEVRRFRLTAS